MWIFFLLLFLVLLHSKRLVHFLFIDVLFWLCTFFMVIFNFVGFIVIRKIKQKTKEIGGL